MPLPGREGDGLWIALREAPRPVTEVPAPRMWPLYSTTQLLAAVLPYITFSVNKAAFPLTYCEPIISPRLLPASSRRHTTRVSVPPSHFPFSISHFNSHSFSDTQKSSLNPSTNIHFSNLVPWLKHPSVKTPSNRQLLPAPLLSRQDSITPIVGLLR